MTIATLTASCAAVRGRRVLVTSFVSALAASLSTGMGGCHASSSDRTASGVTNRVGQPIPAGFTAPGFDQSNMSGLYEVGYFAEEGQRTGLPARFVSEAQDASTELAAFRAEAQAFDINARSAELTAIAEADAALQEARTSRDVAEAEARRMAETFDAELGALVEQIDARRTAFESRQIASERSLEAEVREYEALVAKLRSRADADWSNALAEHERMLAERDAVQARGEATIDRMVRTAEMTEQRTAERVRTLRVDAESKRDSTSAEADELAQQIATARKQTDAEAAELLQFARTLEAESRSRVAELRAQADALEATDADSGHRLSTIGLHVSYADQLEEANSLREQAVQLGQRSSADTQRRRAEAEENLELARVMFEEANEGVEARLDQAIARSRVMEARADEIERTARAAFVAAEVEARVAAAREQAAHQRALAGSEFEKIRAEAEVEAQEFETRLRGKIAKQAQRGKVTIGSDEPGEALTASAATPELARGSIRAARIGADRKAAFRVGLADAARLRLEADALRDEARATHDEEIADFTLWWEQKRASHETTLAELSALHLENEARVSELYARADGLEAAAEASRRRGESDADSTLKEVVAQATLLRRQADAEERRAASRIAQVFARAEATRRNGKAFVMNLEARRDATIRRGTAEVRQTLTEASSLEQSGAAQLAQLHEQVDAARTVLEAELRRLDQSSGSFLAIARSDYSEALAEAESAERIAIATAAEASAVHAADRQRAEAEFAYMNDVARSQEIVAEARVDRFLARSDAELGIAQAHDIASRAGISSRRRAADAWVGGQYAAADAREMSVVARFDHRLAQNEANRNRAFAQAFLEGEMQRTHAERAVAAAQAHQDMLNEAVARLDRAQATFQQTAQTDWDTRLAQPGDFTTNYEPVSVPAGEFYTGPRFERPAFDESGGFGSTFVIAPTE